VSSSQPITRPRSAADKLGLAPTTLRVPGPQLITIAAGDSVTWSNDGGSLRIPTKSPADSEMMSPGDTE
jgi:plastocyanin